MPYVGNQIRQYSDRVVLDSLTASATADYTLQLNSVDFVPSSAESLTVSLNGIIQAPNSSYTVSSSTLSFSSALTASDTIDFVIAERGITLQTPSAGSVNTAQLASSAVTNAKIATPLTLGKIGQIVTGSTTTQVSHNTSSYTDSNLSASITPSSTSSKIYITANIAFLVQANNLNAGGSFRILRDSTAIVGGEQTFENYISATGATAVIFYGRDNINYLDSPSTTSSITYKIQGRQYLSGDAIQSSPDSIESRIILMEVLG